MGFSIHGDGIIVCDECGIDFADSEEADNHWYDEHNPF
jgi:hypothetical protein